MHAPPQSAYLEALPATNLFVAVVELIPIPNQIRLPSEGPEHEAGVQLSVDLDDPDDGHGDWRWVIDKADQTYIL